MFEYESIDAAKTNAKRKGNSKKDANTVGKCPKRIKYVSTTFGNKREANTRSARNTSEQTNGREHKHTDSYVLLCVY